MTNDPIVEEVRRAGDAYFRQFNYDLKAALDDLRRRSERAGRETVSRPPRRLTEERTKAR
jgi:hypothetical protein